MTVTIATRFSVVNVDVATAEAKRAKALWTKVGAKDFRSRQFYTGQFNGEWLFHIDFDDWAHLQKCRDVVQKSRDMKTITTNNAKAGNKQVAREMLLGLDV